MFSGRVALVTGAGRGLGAATARELAAEGAHVLVNDVDPAAAESLCEELRRAGGSAGVAIADVSCAAQVADLFERAASDHGGVDLLVNNAGIVSRARLADFPDEDWARVVDLNLGGVYLCVKHFARLAPRSGARRAIVNVASLSYRGMTQQIAYVSAKGGVVSLTRGAAMELARDGIRVNCVAPGMIDTDMTAAANPGHEELRRRMIPQIPLGRYGCPTEVARTIAFLLSEAASYITGETVHVAGGARL
jgi:3-oxoacyl-[acyl-carrier protein] reductase